MIQCLRGTPPPKNPQTRPPQKHPFYTPTHPKHGILVTRFPEVKLLGGQTPCLFRLTTRGGSKSLAGIMKQPFYLWSANYQEIFSYEHKGREKQPVLPTFRAIVAEKAQLGVSQENLKNVQRPRKSRVVRNCGVQSPDTFRYMGDKDFLCRRRMPRRQVKTQKVQK